MKPKKGIPLDISPQKENVRKKPKSEPFLGSDLEETPGWLEMKREPKELVLAMLVRRRESYWLFYPNLLP